MVSGRASTVTKATIKAATQAVIFIVFEKEERGVKRVELGFSACVKLRDESEERNLYISMIKLKKVDASL